MLAYLLSSQATTLQNLLLGKTKCGAGMCLSLLKITYQSIAGPIGAFVIRSSVGETMIPSHLC